MAKKRKQGKQKKPKVWVCRGKKCGRERQHPGVDHDRLLGVLRGGAQRAGAKCAVTDCLGPCGQGNVVVARVGGRIRWFRKMNDEASSRALVAHLDSGAGLGDLPEGLRRRVMPKRDDRKPDP